MNQYAVHDRLNKHPTFAFADTGFLEAGFAETGLALAEAGLTVLSALSALSALEVVFALALEVVAALLAFVAAALAFSVFFASPEVAF